MSGSTVVLDLSALHECWRRGFVTTDEYMGVHTQLDVLFLLNTTWKMRLVGLNDSEIELADYVRNECLRMERETLTPEGA